MSTNFASYYEYYQIALNVLYALTAGAELLTQTLYALSQLDNVFLNFTNTSNVIKGDIVGNLYRSFVISLFLFQN